MSEILPRRMAAEIEGDFVVFVIGMRINKPWKLHQWLPVFLAMPRMLKELERRPESGFLGAVSGGLLIVQYWRSFEHLEAYARSRDHLHWPAWVAFNKRTGRSRGDVGIWHETYLVRAGEYEAIYSGMPRHGLGRAGTLVPATGQRDSARGRAGRPAAPLQPAASPGTAGAGAVPAPGGG
ncbi:DUF4188 domain-containing protein [Caldimonas tepidiphila]|uniref:DUF4188 domain-containing protein n=1 Tax=Caldimonas tepidiphila TaxID=2315841 RepID=UPI000E5A11E3|nr:DUF4188 domain-containing protein [Caldimonas tepidiphila]